MRRSILKISESKTWLTTLWQVKFTGWVFSHGTLVKAAVRSVTIAGDIQARSYKMLGAKDMTTAVTP